MKVIEHLNQTCGGLHWYWYLKILNLILGIKKGKNSFFLMFIVNLDNKDHYVAYLKVSSLRVSDSMEKGRT